MEHHELHKVYSALDFSLLPTQLEETWKATTNPRQSDEAYSELNRFITVITKHSPQPTTSEPTATPTYATKSTSPPTWSETARSAKTT